MSHSLQPTTEAASMPGIGVEQSAQYVRDGFVILRGFVPREQIAGLADEATRLLVECANHISPDNLRCRFQPDVETGEPLFEVFDPVCDISPVIQAFAEDRQILEVMSQVLGEPACLFKDKLIYKPARAKGYDLHQDIPLNWPGFPRTFHTLLVPIDSMNQDNGCTVLYRGQHERGFLALPGTSGFPLPDDCVREEDAVALDLLPGDIAIFGGLVPHRSAPNRTNGPRRALYLSYNAESEGGSMRDRHYREFHEWMRRRTTGDANSRLRFW
ncbi:MAG: phytanoyl-CoA dioxygenase family protein [Planctomycetota bacterium]|nr:phytanoyl-CoA dioxygenase family protein [Planctomycetota bacterium]